MIDSVKHRHPRNRRQSNREKRGKWEPEVDSDTYGAGTYDMAQHSTALAFGTDRRRRDPRHESIDRPLMQLFSFQ